MCEREKVEEKDRERKVCETRDDNVTMTRAETAARRRSVGCGRDLSGSDSVRSEEKHGRERVKSCGHSGECTGESVESKYGALTTFRSL